MKKFITIALVFCAFIFTKAQEGFHKIGIGAEIAFPMGDFGKGFSTGFGGTGKVFYGLNEKSDITGTIGYLHFGIKDDEFISGHISMIPLQFGYRYDFGGFYAEPQLGLMFMSSKVELKGFAGAFGNTSGTASETKFSLAIGGGYEFGSWDIGARYQILDHANFLGIRVGYNFSL